MTRPTPADVTSWLLRETPEHMELMSKLRAKLAQTMDEDTNEDGTPSRDWCRALSRYQTTYQMLINEDRERMRLRIMMRRSGEELLSDDEYAQELQRLAVESLGTLSTDELQREMERRAALAPPVEEERDDD